MLVHAGWTEKKDQTFKGSLAAAFVRLAASRAGLCAWRSFGRNGQLLYVSHAHVAALDGCGVFF